MATATQLMVGMAEIEVHKGPAVFTCLGLGSCIGLFGVDAEANVAGMVHIMLPEKFAERPVDKVAKFADTAVPELLRMFREQGADPSRLVWAYAGGAQVFQFGADKENRLDIGARNVVAVVAQVKIHRLRVLAHDTGGSNGRTMVADTTTGIVRLRTVTAGERELCRFGV